MNKIYVIQIVSFDYYGIDNVRFGQSIYHEFFNTTEDAEAKVAQLSADLPKKEFRETSYFIQTLYANQSGPRIYIVSNQESKSVQ